MSSFANLLTENQEQLKAYNSGDIGKASITKGVATLNELQKLKSKLKKTNFIQHFLDLNNNIPTKSEFIGGLVKCSFDKAIVSTSSKQVIQQRGISTGTLLIAALPNSILEQKNLPPHFLLLRVSSKEGENDTAQEQIVRLDNNSFFYDDKKSNANNQDEPSMSNEEKRAYYKTLQNELFHCHVLGMFFPYSNRDITAFDFSPQIDLLLSANYYLVFKPDTVLLNAIINTQMILDAKLDKPFDYFEIGDYRETESEAFLPNPTEHPRTKVYESINIFMNSRTANFGNTRFGKSNLNKIFASNIIQYNQMHKDNLGSRIGMLIYDENGEYYHINTQDGTSLYEKHKGLDGAVARYTLRKNENDNLMLNFYLNPRETISAMRSLLDKDNGRPIYIESFLSIEFPDIVDFCSYLPESIEQLRKNGETLFISESEAEEEVFKVQLLWALLYKSKFEYMVETQNKVRAHFFNFFDESKIIKPFEIPERVMEQVSVLVGNSTDSDKSENNLNDSILIDLIDVYHKLKQQQKTRGVSYEQQFKLMNQFIQRFVEYYLFNKGKFKDKSGLWEKLDPILEMFNSTANKGGYKKLYALRDMHSANSRNSMWKLIDDITLNGKVCILDLSTTTNIKAKKFYAEKIDTSIFKAKEKHFSENKTLDYPMVLLNYEEAHNLFPTSASSSSIYIKLAREGAKMQIGIIYNTQFITSIYGELKSLTENTFVGYINNQHEIADLSNVNYTFRNSGHEIMTVRRVGYMSILTKNRRFPIRVQINKFI